MQKKTEDFSIEQVKQLAENPAAAQLLAMLQQTDAAQLQHAAQLASDGQFEQAIHALQATLSSRQAQQLLQQLGK